MRIARELIDADADKVVRRLARHGHQAYLVGGCVRDLLLGRDPKDFDVSTSATPKEIKQLFRNCRIIGRRFRLAHIFFGGKIIETSTFRANPREGEDGTTSELLIRRDNVFGSATEDAQRRDFRINGLFYDVEAETVIDHVDGLKDLKARVISTIGVPGIRFREDPVRMMRAIKFAARLGFTIGPTTYAAIRRHGAEISKCAAPRVLEELYRLLKGGAARRSLELLVESGLAETLSGRLALMFRETETARADDEADWAATWADDDSQRRGREGDSEQPKQDGKNGQEKRASVSPIQPEPFSLPWLSDIEVAARRAIGWRMLESLDVLVSEHKETSSSLVIATLCCPFVADELVNNEMRPSEASELVSDVLFKLTEELGIARRDAERARQILLAIRRLAPSKRRRGKPMALVRRDYFDDALLTYQMWSDVTGRDPSELEYWTQLAAGAIEDGEKPTKKRRRRRGGRRRRRTEAVADFGLGDEELDEGDEGEPNNEDSGDDPGHQKLPTENGSPKSSSETGDSPATPKARRRRPRKSKSKENRSETTTADRPESSTDEISEKDASQPG